MKTIKQALACVTPETICTVCGRAANDGYVNVNAREACTARIHDAYGSATLTRRVVRAELVRKWEATGRPRLLGVPGAGLIEQRQQAQYREKHGEK